MNSSVSETSETQPVSTTIQLVYISHSISNTSYLSFGKGYSKLSRIFCAFHDHDWIFSIALITSWVKLTKHGQAIWNLAPLRARWLLGDMTQSSNNQHTRISMITGATILKQVKHGNVIGVSKFFCERLRVSFLTPNSPTSFRKKIGRIHSEIIQRIKQQSVDSCDEPERKLIIVHCVSCFWRDYVNKKKCYFN